jgi:hypothetical protein
MSVQDAAARVEQATAGLTEAISDAVDQVEAKAREFDLARFVLTLVALPFVVLGWCARFVVRAVAWCWAAVQVGWSLATERRQTGGS